MDINLRNLVPALLSVGADASKATEAIGILEDLLAELDDVEVKGRQKVDTLLGCMMALDAIIGKEDGHG